MPIFKKPDNQQQIYKQTSSTLHTSNDMSRRKNVFMELKKKKKFIKSLSQHFEKEIYQYVNISLQKTTSFLKRTPSGCFLQEKTCVGASFYF